MSSRVGRRRLGLAAHCANFLSGSSPPLSSQSVDDGVECQSTSMNVQRVTFNVLGVWHCCVLLWYSIVVTERKEAEWNGTELNGMALCPTGVLCLIQTNAGKGEGVPPVRARRRRTWAPPPHITRAPTHRAVIDGTYSRKDPWLAS